MRQPAFQEFKSKIQREFLDGSAIAPDLFSAAIEILSDTQFSLGGDVSYPIHEALNWHVTRFGAEARENLEAALFRNEDQSPWQVKLSRSLQPDRKPYLAPKGKGSQAFTPAVTVQIWVKIAQRYNLIDRLPQWVRSAHKNRDFTLTSSARGFGVNPKESSFWQWVRDNDIEIVLTEGGKKSLCLLSHGYVAIALYGCDGGRLVNDLIAGEKIRKLKPELIPDLKPFATEGREFVFAFDQDAKFETRYKVSRALGQLGDLLIEADCKVKVATWDGKDGKGIDDLIVNRGVVAWEQSYSEAETLAQWRIQQHLAREVRRKPDLNIGDREFTEIALELPTSGIAALHGGKGSGKSKAIGKCLKLSRWLSITHLTSLGRDQSAGWAGVFVNDGDFHGSKLLKDGMPVNGGSVCVPSLMKVSAVEVDTLVLDEVTATLEFLLGSKLANKDGIRPLLLSEFVRRVRAARLVVIADADLTEEALQFIEEIRGERAYLVRSERKALTYEATVIDGSKDATIALLQQHIDQLPDGKIIYINCDAKGLADSLTELLGRSQTLLISGDTSGGEIETSFLASKGRDLPNLILQGIRFIISSPSVVQGFSIEHHTNLIDSVWGFYSGCSISAHQIAQAPDRVRDSQVPRYFWIANKGSAYSKHSGAFNVSTYLKEFRQLNTAAARLVSHSLKPETAQATELIDWQSENLKMFAALEVRRNRGMVALRETLIALLRKEGKRVKVIRPNLSKSEIQSAKAAITEASRVTHKRYCEAVAIALDLTDEAAKLLENRTEALTPDEALSLTKYYLKDFYELETVTSADVEFDRKGQTRTEIKRLEAVLHPDLATQRTVKSIERNPDTPQDWKPDVIALWLLEQSGAAALICQIAAGEIERLPADQVQSISAFVRSHSVEFRLAFNFRNIETQSDQQIIGEILSRHGIHTQRCGNRNNRRYEVCKPELETLLAIIERRRKEISPLEKIEVDREGAIAEDPFNSEDLADIRGLYESSSDPEARRLLQESIPPDLWERAIYQIA
ncbi:plasmid replication protein, CyRepA1 family [Leptolyngbya sp. NIES-2104]|uniref:plasmid replication protein, CyRepA1 family n=1 Tax=Leptolyngbya sp. NIES-2104 TaxID=1552121 RepID=UPI0006ECAADD|nr:plasmid replication protein, CyRepA1 family [Leptolyngbya sp. NIES-2104]GAQ00189.1 DNA primase [Leptolyngbya sp. NIES-2104]